MRILDPDDEAFLSGLARIGALHSFASLETELPETHNLAALAYFLPNGHVLPLLAAAMAVANLGGSLAGTWLALKHGSGFIRRIFLLLAAVLIVKFAWDTLAPFL